MNNKNNDQIQWWFPIVFILMFFIATGGPLYILYAIQHPHPLEEAIDSYNNHDLSSGVREIQEPNGRIEVYDAENEFLGYTDELDTNGRKYKEYKQHKCNLNKIDEINSYKY